MDQVIYQHHSRIQLSTYLVRRSHAVNRPLAKSSAMSESFRLTLTWVMAWDYDGPRLSATTMDQVIYSPPRQELRNGQQHWTRCSVWAFRIDPGPQWTTMDQVNWLIGRLLG